MSVLSRFNSNFSVGTRIRVGFGALLTLLLGISITGYLGLTDAESGLGTYAVVSSNEVRLREIDTSFAKLRREALVFADTGDAAAVGRMAALRNSLDAGIKRAIETVTDPETGSKLSEIGKLLEQYGNNLDAVVKLRAVRQRAVGEGMGPIGQSLETGFAEVVRTALADGDFAGAAHTGVAQQTVMQVRLMSNRFLTEPSPDLKDEAIRLAEAVAASMRRLRSNVRGAEQQARLSRLNGLVAEFGSAFEEAATAIEIVHRIVNTDNAKLAVRLGEAIDEVSAAQHAELVALAERVALRTADTIRHSATLAATAVAVGLFLAWAIARGISGPVGAMTTAMTGLAGGNLDTEIPARDNKDEIGEMAKSVQIFKENLQETERLRAEQDAAKSKAEADRRQTMLDLAGKFEASVGRIVQGVTAQATELQSTAETMVSTAEETARQATAVSAASEQATQNVQTVASATEELSASVREIGQQVSTSTSKIGDAVRQADVSNEQVQGLAEAAQKIGDIVRLINDIAGQTNLLALNATIEAARAGEAGKGFAVVASEVKALANQTSRATDEIGQQVRAIQEATQRSVHSIQTIATTIGEVNRTAAAISSAIEEQGAATQEIARNVQQASRGTQDVSSNIAGVDRSAQESGAAAAQVLASAAELSRNSENLRRQVETFLAEVRAA